MKSLPQFIAMSSTKIILFFKLTVSVSVVQYHKSVITIYILYTRTHTSIYLSTYLPSLWTLPPLPSPTPPLWVITELQAGLPVLHSAFPLAMFYTALHIRHATFSVCPTLSSLLHLQVCSLYLNRHYLKTQVKSVID